MAEDLSGSRAGGLIPAEALAHVPGYTPDAPDVRVAPLTGGSVNRSYSVLTSAGRFVLRVSPGVDAWLAADRSVEVTLHEVAAAAGLAPRIVHADARDRWLVTEYVVGAMWNAGAFVDPDSLGRLGDRLRQLHSLPPPAAGRFDLLHALERYVRLIEGSGNSGSGTLEPLLERAEQAWRASGASERSPALLHHDLHASNIIDSEHGIVLIDWECAAVSDPLLDIACLLSYYEGSRGHAALLLRHAGLGDVSALQLESSVWLFDLHTYLWYRERRRRRRPTPGELEAERRLGERLGVVQA